MRNLILGSLKTQFESVFHTESKTETHHLTVEFDTIPFGVSFRVAPPLSVTGNITLEFYLDDTKNASFVNHFKQIFDAPINWNNVPFQTTTVVVFESEDGEYNESDSATKSEKDVIRTTKDD